MWDEGAMVAYAVSRICSAMSSRPRGAVSRALGLTLIAIWLGTPAMASWEDNQCVTCHEAERLPISLGHSFEEWRASEHARSGVACEKCHGGDPTEKDEAAAHRDVLPAADPASMVNPRRIAATCGGCHEKEFKAYSGTVHAQQVAQAGEGATCYTCHGSMATSLPSPAELSSRCSVCHKKPVQAQVALAMLAATKMHLHRTRRNLDKAKETDPEWALGAQSRFRELEQRYRDLEPAWHVFAVDTVVEQSRALVKLAKLLDEEISVRAQLQH